MSHTLKKPNDLTRKDVERIQKRHFRRVWPYYERLQTEWILKDLDKQREAKNSETKEDS